MRIDILTLFPEMLEATLATSIVKRAQDCGHVEIHVHDIRNWSDNKHRKVDHRPYGGGPGMVMMCQPLHDAVQEVERQSNIESSPVRIHFTPQGEVLKQERVEQLASEQHLLLIAGHYEGIDERVIETLDPLELSTGDYVLSGGEIPALLLVDAVVRLLPGALGNCDSADQDSFSKRGSEGKRLLDCPHYTRPRVWNEKEVPEVLLSGDHSAVDKWREEQMVSRTKSRRPDLLEQEEVDP
ncbi:MAG TPA: tRNA (guanosine(37)-N1)-methyltransferase TrmD [Phycisphaerales bacterium]|nr:tRNA (guanosine(37)-N1)-methyltransferase TrmD [Phycisphaerales bacterium]HIB01213.1 tRNA (guanosine(37)-N1)-methyltransferase TrmD [Phycisphaerales bacterium]HIB50523.1 tRNA (guanosine(37)-N1)-methyltransferase TrmD [Phycisphaerales bacterium]HIN83959.1 tRNA (guanosine(37)-N1)-methyltransferase TrmD [Phycisphaerales bacterium]HIO52604.1 tRNA (guanosine(37)-N1)-methyltransferase TrmD [Phycisphaerales bacterium]